MQRTTLAPLDESFAIVTPTYHPDLARCELLAESLDRIAPRVKHYLIVDRRDWRAFSHLQTNRRQLIESEALLGRWIWRMPGNRGFWLSLRSPPVRGWIIQQILKIAAIDAIKERTLVFCDSDTAFFRSFGREALLIDGKVGLLDIGWSNESTVRWTNVARRLFGATETEPVRGYVGNMICWNRETILAMRQRIENIAGRNWQTVLARETSFSEYMLYGVFVREVVGYGAVDHAPSTVPLVKPSWGVKLDSDGAIDEFFSKFDPRTVAVMIHSKDRVNLDRVRFQLTRLWSAGEGTLTV